MTVSRALRGIGRLRPETRERIRKLAVEMNYQAIRGLVIPPPVRRGKADHTLRLLVPTIFRRMSQEGGEWFLESLMKGLRDRLALSNGVVLEAHFQSVDEVIEVWKRDRYHGVVLRQPVPRPWIDRLKAVGPVVLVFGVDFHYGVDNVYENEQRAASDIHNRLTGLGHRRIAWLGILDLHEPHRKMTEDPDDPGPGMNQDMSVQSVRYSAWARLAVCQPKAHRMPLVLVERDWRRQGLEEVVQKGLDEILSDENHPTAIVCSCDAVARSVIRNLQNRRYRVPEDFSVVTYGMEPGPNDPGLPLSGMAMPMETMGRMVPELIERRLADPHAPAISMQFEATWCEGGTVGPARLAEADWRK